MKNMFTRLGKAFHQIFIYFNLIDEDNHLSISKLTLYTSFAFTLVLIWFGAGVFNVSITAGLTVLCFINYAYKRWMTYRIETYRLEVYTLEEKVAILNLSKDMALHEERKLKKKLSKVEKDAYDKKVNTLERNLTSAEHINNTLSKQVAAINAKLNMSRNLGPPEGQPFPLNRNQTL